MSHQIELPPELFAEWLAEWFAEGRALFTKPALFAAFVAEKTAEWAADQQLEACCEWLEKGPYGFSIAATAPDLTDRLRAAMRPKPPSLKEQALAVLEEIMDELHEASGSGFTASVIRRALESIPDADS